MIKRILITFLITLPLTFNTLRAQESFGFGVSTFSSLGVDFTRYGLTASLERPRNEVNTFFLRGVFTLPVSIKDSFEVEKDFNLDPIPPGPAKIDVPISRKTTLLSVEGGTRYYLLNTYDAGTALYGGFHMRGFLSTYSEDLGSDFETPEGYIVPNRSSNQTSVLLSFGANIGFKYQLPMGNAINFDIVGDLIRSLYDPAYILSNEVNPLAISFNISYRFDNY